MRAYDSEEGRKELSAALLSSILDLAERVRISARYFLVLARSKPKRFRSVSRCERMPEIRSAIESRHRESHPLGRHDRGRPRGDQRQCRRSRPSTRPRRGGQAERLFPGRFRQLYPRRPEAFEDGWGWSLGHELGGLSGDGWRAFRRGAPKGIERGASPKRERRSIVGEGRARS